MKSNRLKYNKEKNTFFRNWKKSQKDSSCCCHEAQKDKFPSVTEAWQKTAKYVINIISGKAKINMLNVWFGRKVDRRFLYISFSWKFLSFLRFVQPLRHFVHTKNAAAVSACWRRVTFPWRFSARRVCRHRRRRTPVYSSGLRGPSYLANHTIHECPRASEKQK